MLQVKRVLKYLVIFKKLNLGFLGGESYHGEVKKSFNI